MPVTEADVLEALRPVEDPELHRSIVDLGMVKGIAIDGSTVAVRVALTVAGCPLRNEITTRVTDAAVAKRLAAHLALDRSASCHYAHLLAALHERRSRLRRRR